MILLNHAATVLPAWDVKFTSASGAVRRSWSNPFLRGQT